MIRVIKAMLLGAPVLTLTGCVTTNVDGGDVGGTIPMAGLTRQQAAEVARNHCAAYGRSAHILAIRPDDNGMKAIFECKS